MILDINNTEEINKVFCDIVGIKPIKGLLINNETDEVRTYQSINSLYRTPKGWNDVQRVVFDDFQYPDFTDLDNFYILLSIQWDLFGNLGDSYSRMKDESFPLNYLYNKVKALQTLKAYGGSDMLYEFCRRVRESQYTFTIKEEE